jgi:hypothetical protein
MADGSIPQASLLARAGAWARRPQTAMGAVFLLTAASSLLVLARKHHGNGASLSVHEQGQPLAVDAPSTPESPPAAAPAPALFHDMASASPARRPRTGEGAIGSASIEDALALQQKGNLDGALEILRSLGEGGDTRARFLQGKVEKERSGCARAREVFARLATDPQAGSLAFDARLEEGRCARQLDDDEGARRALQSLLDVPSHRERALAELRELD